MLGNSGVLMRIIESEAACTYVRNRTYPKRRAKSKRHWARMDKKYAKRYGNRLEPLAYRMNASGVFPGCYEEVLVVHPLLAPEYRRALNASFERYGG